MRSNSDCPGSGNCGIDVHQTAVYDPACGTGGFLLAAHDYIEKNYSLDKDQKRFLKSKTFYGEDIVDGPGTGSAP
jgi:type I restriction-modification system DNA methylase subunit